MLQSQTQDKSQGFLFSEPSVSETGVWCELNEGIEPSEWAFLCRYLGKMSPEKFKKVKNKVYFMEDSLIERIKKLFRFEQSECEGIPLVKLGR